MIAPETFKAFKEGHEKACELVFYDLYEALVLFSFGIVQDWMEAEDIAIETFQKMAPNAAGKDTYQDFRAWIFTAVRNRSINFYHRRRNRIVSIEERLISEPSEDSVSKWILEREVIMTIREEIDQLKKEEDKVLAEFLIFRQLPPKKIAELLGMNEQTVRNKKGYFINRFLNALKKKNLPIFLLF
jgi:RNA polymerase sigma-70 factor (ECF subfamily)